MTVLIDTYFFDLQTSRQAIHSQELEPSEGKTRREHWCCAVCGFYVTNDNEKIEVDGQHHHFKANPQGQTYQIRCFQNAEGCAAVGQPTQEHTWFTGLYWTYAHCRSCGTQLGWFFSGQSHFFGLINEQIRHCNQEDET